MTDLYDGDGEEGDGEERHSEQVGGQDHAGHVGQDEEEGCHKPRKYHPAGVLGISFQYYKCTKTSVTFALPYMSMMLQTK